MNAYYKKIETSIDETTYMTLYVVYYEAVRGDGMTYGSIYTNWRVRNRRSGKGSCQRNKRKIDMKDYINKQEDSLSLIRKYSPYADRFGGYKVAFSGGKDSQVMLDLFRKAGVRYTAHYNVTTNDPPENVYFIRKHYPEVEFVFPEMNFFHLIEEKHFLPTTQERFCCKHLKESRLKGFVAVGVRREESKKRQKYQVVEFASANEKYRTFDIEKMRKNRKVSFRPLLEWREDEIWEYIEDNDIPINPCYDISGRVGCMFCPYSNKKTIHYYKQKYPRYYTLLLRSIEKALDRGYQKKYQPLKAEDVFYWWLSKQTAKTYFTQLKLDL